MGDLRDKDVFLRRACQACAYVSVIDAEGQAAIGSSFHLGDGYYATARHVVHDMQIAEFGPFTQSYLIDNEICDQDRELSKTKIIRGSQEHVGYSIFYRTPPVVSKVYFHENADVDVAIIKVEGIDRNTPALILPPFLDDALGAIDLMLEEVLILGYPPIPFTNEPTIVAAIGHVNAIVDTRKDRYIRTILSATPRGGFSGGPALLAEDFVLGVITESLEASGRNESGFLAVLSPVSVGECMDQNNIRPPPQVFDF